MIVLKKKMLRVGKYKGIDYVMYKDTPLYIGTSTLGLQNIYIDKNKNGEYIISYETDNIEFKTHYYGNLEEVKEMQNKMIYSEVLFRLYCLLYGKAKKQKCFECNSDEGLRLNFDDKIYEKSFCEFYEKNKGNNFNRVKMLEFKDILEEKIFEKGFKTLCLNCYIKQKMKEKKNV